MIIKLSDKEFKKLIGDTISDHFNLYDNNQDFSISHSYSGVEITTFEMEDEEVAPEED